MQLFYELAQHDFITKKEELIQVLIGFLTKHERQTRKYVSASTLTFLKTLKPQEYILGQSDQDFVSVIAYLATQSLTLEQTIRETVLLIWDLISYTSDEICPGCQQTNLRLYTGENTSDIYETCIECSARRKNGQWIYSREELYPANKSIILAYLDDKQSL